MTLKKSSRNKEVKIEQIIHSTKMLIEEKGYNKVSIRNIAEDANVSIGLIYKYFPKGKIDILKQLSFENTNETLMISQPDKINFNDFPYYIREVIKNMLELNEKNSKIIKAATFAALINDEILDDIEMIKPEDYAVIPELFNKFHGVNIPNKDIITVLTQWSLTIKSLIFYDNIFPTIFKDEESFIDMLVDLSLKIWNYNKNE